MVLKTRYEIDNLPPWITNLRDELKLTGVAVGLIRIPMGKGYTYMHSHREQEEVYIALEGEGIMQIDGGNIPFGKGDIVKVPAPVKRALKASDSGDLVLICVGGVTQGYPRRSESKALIDDGIPDFDDIPPWYADNEKIIALNRDLKNQRDK